MEAGIRECGKQYKRERKSPGGSTGDSSHGFDTTSRSSTHHLVEGVVERREQKVNTDGAATLASAHSGHGGPIAEEALG